jgi:hypothetical protein
MVHGRAAPEPKGDTDDEDGVVPLTDADPSRVWLAVTSVGVFVLGLALSRRHPDVWLVERIGLQRIPIPVDSELKKGHEHENNHSPFIMVSLICLDGIGR